MKSNNEPRDKEHIAPNDAKTGRRILPAAILASLPAVVHAGGGASSPLLVDVPAGGALGGLAAAGAAALGAWALARRRPRGCGETHAAHEERMKAAEERIKSLERRVDGFSDLLSRENSKLYDRINAVADGVAKLQGSFEAVFETTKGKR